MLAISIPISKRLQISIRECQKSDKMSTVEDRSYLGVYF
jgi:hypothetical protein